MEGPSDEKPTLETHHCDKGVLLPLCLIRSVLELPSARVLHETYLAAVVFGEGRDEVQYGRFGAVRPCSSFAAIRKRLARWDGEQGCGEEGVAPAARGLWQRLGLGSGERRCCDDPTHRYPRPPAEVGPHDRRHLFVKCSPTYQLGQQLSATLPQPEPGRRNFRHTFQIRRPDKVALSLCVLAEHAEGTAGGTENVCSLLAADLSETHRLYHHVAAADGSAPMVIDADDLLADPAATLQGYCAAVGLPYTPAMLRWEAGPVDDWLPHGSEGWEAGPFANVYRSTGFRQPASGDTPPTVSEPPLLSSAPPPPLGRALNCC